MEVKHVSSTRCLTQQVSILSALGNLNTHSAVWGILAAYHAKTRLFGDLCTTENQSNIIQERGKGKKCGEVALYQKNIAVIKMIWIKPKKPGTQFAKY